MFHKRRWYVLALIQILESIQALSSNTVTDGLTCYCLFDTTVCFGYNHFWTITNHWVSDFVAK